MIMQHTFSYGPPTYKLSVKLFWNCSCAKSKILKGRWVLRTACDLWRCNGRREVHSGQWWIGAQLGRVLMYYWQRVLETAQLWAANYLNSLHSVDRSHTTERSRLFDEWIVVENVKFGGLSAWFRAVDRRQIKLAARQILCVKIVLLHCKYMRTAESSVVLSTVPMCHWRKRPISTAKSTPSRV